MKHRFKSSHATPSARRALSAAIVGLFALLPTLSQAQSFDRQAYEQHAQECVNSLEYAEQALGAGNVDRALTYIQLAVDPCDTARGLLITGLGDSSLSSRQQTALQGDLVSQDSRWASLAAQLGMCEEARSMLGETMRLVPEIPSDRMDRYMAATQAVMTCTPSGAPTGTPTPGPVTPPVAPTGMPLNGTVTVGPGYPATSGSGVAGGPEDANVLFGESCWGATTADPNFHMVVTAEGWVQVQARSDSDLTMVLSGPSGIFCNDDYDGLNPGLSEYLVAGTYQVWFGEFSRSATGSAFTATFSAGAATPPVPSTAPTYGYVTVGPGYAATSGAGMAGGPDDANAIFGEPCRGAIPTAPQYQLDVVGYGLVTVQVTSAGDTTLVVSGPGGTFCNDDYQGLNPAISENMSPGTYLVWIGEYSRSGTGTAYDILFSNEMLQAGGQTPVPSGLTATYGTAYVGPGYGMTTLNGVSGGTLDASVVYGGNCVGRIAQTPDFLLEVTGASTVSISVNATDGGDTSLVVTGPSGTFCNDDTNGLNPALTQYLVPGTYQVFSGSYWEGEYHNIVVNFSSY